MTGLDLRHHIEFRRARRRRRRRLACVPGRIVHAACSCAPTTRDRLAGNSTSSRRLPRESNVRSLGVFSLAMWPRAAIAAEPQCCPNSRFPLRRSAAIHRDRIRKRWSSANDRRPRTALYWLSTSWVANEACVMAALTARRFRNQFTPEYADFTRTDFTCDAPISGNHMRAFPRPAAKNATTLSNSSQNLASPLRRPAGSASGAGRV